MLCLVNLVYAGRFSVNLCGVDARLLVRSFIERELVPSPRESTRPWRLAEPVKTLLSIAGTAQSAQAGSHTGRQLPKKLLVPP